MEAERPVVETREDRRASRAAEQIKVEARQAEERKQAEEDRKAQITESEEVREKAAKRAAGAVTGRGERAAAEPEKRATEAQQNEIDLLEKREKALLGKPTDPITPAIKRELERVRGRLKELKK